MIVKKQELRYVPFETYANVTDKLDLEAKAKQDHLYTMEHWLLPQILAHYGRWEPVLVEGQISGIDTLKQNIQKDPWEIGLWRVCTQLSRGMLVKSQGHQRSAEYGRFTPLIMAGLKKYKDIPYSHWHREHLDHCMDPLLLEAILADYEPFTVDELLEAREEGLLIKSGTKLGQLKPILSTWKLSGIPHLRVGKLPVLAQTMLCQVWLAHPSIRNASMILDPKSWDTLPKALIDSEVITPAKKETSPFGHVPQKLVVEDNRLPWEM